MTTTAPDALAFAAVEVWLSGWPPDAIVGFPLCNDGCPLAVFLRAQGFPTAHVYPGEWSEWHHATEDRWHPMPPWASAYQQALDEEYGDRRIERPWCNLGNPVPITAAEALAVLRNLELPEAVLA